MSMQQPQQQHHQQQQHDRGGQPPSPPAGKGTGTALVLGATGGIGGEVGRSLRDRGWKVRALNRNLAGLSPAAEADGLQWVQGDAMDRAAVSAAARGTDLIVHAVNPPGYRRWSELVLPMIDNSIVAARATGASLLLPGTVYNFGPLVGDLTEETPQEPLTRKGAIRVEMERRLRKAAGDGVRSLVVRAGDFFGARAANNWFSQMVKPGRAVKVIVNPGRKGAGHQWAYLPDVARTMVDLVDRAAELDPFAVFHMQGHWDADGTAFVEAIRRSVGDPNIPARAFPWWLVGAAAPVVPLFRELKEMRYLWERPLRMRNDRLVDFLGHEAHTPLDEAVGTTLAGLSCTATGRLPGRREGQALSGL